MYGKHFSSMYEGSMVGAGSHVFALMGYVIANQKPDKQVGAQVRLNPVLLATIFGEKEDLVQDAIDFLCAPDPKSTTPAEGGRRLVKIGQFDYRVVNGAKYLAIRNEEARREQNREAQRRKREKEQGKALPGEKAYVVAEKAGASEAQLAALSEPLSQKPV